MLRVTSEIPYGGVLSYAEVAADAGSPRGSRAAGNALGSNPIPIVIPCHRVLRSGGALGGYGGGLERKRWLLELEGALRPSLTAPALDRYCVTSAVGAHCAIGRIAHGHPLRRRHAGRVAQVPLGVERRLHSPSRRP